MSESTQNKESELNDAGTEHRTAHLNPLAYIAPLKRDAKIRAEMDRWQACQMPIRGDIQAE
jgi:hypothetical protein